MVPPPVQLDEDEIDEAVALIEAMTRDDLTGPEFTDGYTDAPFAHAPSGSFQANAAWLALAALAFNLTRAAGTLAGTFHAKVTCATIRDRLINIPVRLARSARRLTLHLPNTGRGKTPSTTPSPPFTLHPKQPDAPSEPPARARDLWICGKAGQTSGHVMPTTGPEHSATTRNLRNNHSEIKRVDPGLSGAIFHQ